jgi:hypothetical protein
MQRFHPAAANASPYGLLSCVEGVINGDEQRCVSSRDDDAG